MPGTHLAGLRRQLGRLLNVEEGDKIVIYERNFAAAGAADLNYWLELVLAAGIATLGLVQNSTAVIIGAMLVSPLMGPILATGLALALGDFYLGWRAVTNLLASVTGAVLLAAGLVWALPFQTVTPEILARTQPNLLDLGVAVFSGVAGSVVSCRGGASGGVTALPGVAIAVALMPPLCVVGFGLGSGFQWSIIRGGGLLFLTNLIAIVASSFGIFLAAGLDSPEVRERIREPHRGLRWVSRIGTLPRRALILGLFLAVIVVPLRSGLERVKEEAMVQSVARAEIRRALPPGSVVSQHLEFGPPVRIQIVATEAVGSDRREELRRRIETRTGQPVELTIQEVARREDVLALAQRRPVTVAELEGARRQILAAVEAALGAAWPQSSAPLAGFSLRLRPEGLELEAAYVSDKPLGGAGEEAVRRAVESRLGARLDLAFEQLEPRRNLVRAGRPPAEARAAAERLAADLGRRPALAARVMIPPGARASLSEALALELEKLGVGSRVRVEKAPAADSWIYALLEAPR